jgi:hypothetical protein
MDIQQQSASALPANRGRLALSAIVVSALALLAGCASGPQGLRQSDLRSPTHFRGEYVIPVSFPQLQMALFKHERACGSAPKFSLDKDQTSYATMVDMPESSPTYEHAVLIDFVQYKPNYLAENRVKAKAYSYYSDRATLDRIDWAIKAITQPGVCQGAAQAD